MENVGSITYRNDDSWKVNNLIYKNTLVAMHISGKESLKNSTKIVLTEDNRPVLEPHRKSTKLKIRHRLGNTSLNPINDYQQVDYEMAFGSGISPTAGPCN